MGLSTLIQIPCHHVLANEIALNLKYCIDLKHFFNINLGIGIIKKLLFLFVFSTYPPVFLLNYTTTCLCLSFRCSKLSKCSSKSYVLGKNYMSSFNEGISPCYMCRNASLLSIIQKGRFLHVENA